MLGDVTFGDELAAVDANRREVVRIDRPTVVREVRVAEDQHGRLEDVGEIERLPGELERLGVIAGREHDARELALRGVQREPQVALLGPRGKPRRRPGAREQADDHRGLAHTCEPERLHHEREAAA